MDWISSARFLSSDNSRCFTPRVCTRWFIHCEQRLLYKVLTCSSETHSHTNVTVTGELGVQNLEQGDFEMQAGGARKSNHRLPDRWTTCFNIWVSINPWQQRMMDSNTETGMSCLYFHIFGLQGRLTSLRFGGWDGHRSPCWSGNVLVMHNSNGRKRLDNEQGYSSSETVFSVLLNN